MCFCQSERCLIRLNMPVSFIWRVVTEKLNYTEERRCKLFGFSISTWSPWPFMCLPLSDNCLHNHLLTLISPSFSQSCALFTHPHYSLLYPSPNSMHPPLVSCFSPTVLLSDMPTGTLTLSSVPLPFTGEWSLITVHGLYDEMPPAHLTSACQLPLTSHCLCALQTVFASLFNDHNAVLPLLNCGVIMIVVF